MGQGNDGKTELPHGKRVRKTDPRIKALALLDELGAVLGLAKAKLSGKKEAADLHKIQLTLLKAAALAAGMDFKTELARETAALEARIEILAKTRKPLREFVLPGRNGTEALLHLARTKARICEIALWGINSGPAAVYLNRLSDYLFLLAEAK